MDASWIKNWHGSKIFVLGDVMLDRFVYGHVERISPEAPIPVLHYQSEKSTLGGAGNVARNIVALGGQALLVGALGSDAEGDLIAGPLTSSDNIEGRFVRAANHPTTTKVRYVSGTQQIMRLDIERPFRMSAHDIDTICGWLVEAIDSVSAILLSDYDKGVLAPALIQRVINIGRTRGIPVIIDPKARDITRYAGATVLTPNAAEAAAIMHLERFQGDAEAEAVARSLLERARVDAVLLTRGAHGVTVYDPTGQEQPVAHVPTAALEVFDVSGAGDTLIAVFALALACGASVQTAARIGNVAAGIVVGKRGTAVVHPYELSTALGDASAWEDPKIVDDDQAVAIVGEWRTRGIKVGFTNGCFDLLHPGHIELLRRSRAACDRLIVALNSDASIRRLKGVTRPVQNERARATVMAAIDNVDFVILFDEDTPLRLIELLRPDHLIKGNDYTLETVVGAELRSVVWGQCVAGSARGRALHDVYHRSRNRRPCFDER